MTEPIHEHAPSGTQPNSVTTGDRATLVNDPIYRITVAVFALLTTGMPATLGQFRFMPIVQAIALTLFLGLALRRGNLRAGYTVLGIWLGVQLVVMTLLTVLLPPHISERAITEGFLHRQALLEWVYAGTAYPSGILVAPLAYLIELVGILLGGLLSAGLIGGWFFMRLVNFTAYSIGTMTVMAQGGLGMLAPLLIWNLLRLLGYAMLFPLVALPLQTGEWTLAAYWPRYRRRILLGGGLILGGILLEVLLTPVWPQLLPQS
ncbi:MAG: hypothetical protein WDZ49_11865 [Litorilinea sp.]